MKLADFRIGVEFYTCTGQHWRCTDIGSRTILAIDLTPELHESWFAGPPYVVEEISFNEKEIRRAYQDSEDSTRDVVEQANNSAHPGFPAEAVERMSMAWCSDDALAYPRPRLWDIERVDDTGEILHPYACERDGDAWRVLLYQPFTAQFVSMPENFFVQLRPATEGDLLRRRTESGQ